MRLTSGQPAPEFEVKDIFGDSHSIEKYRGQKFMLTFFRYASCPLCNHRVHKMIKEYDSWQKKGFQVLTVFESTVESIGEYVGRQDAPFPIIPDPNLELYRKYRLESSWIKFMLAAFPFLVALGRGFWPGRMEGDRAMVPADFLINLDGTIHTAYYGKHIGDHIPLRRIEKFIIE